MPPRSKTDQPPRHGMIVVLDDEENMGKILSKVLQLEGYHVTTFNRPQAALDFINEHGTDVLLSDIRMPGMTGYEVLSAARDAEDPPEVIMMTAFGTIEGAIECVKAGAFDYITKPFKTDELILTVAKAAEHRRLRQVNGALTEALNRANTPPGSARTLVGDSPAMKRARDLIERVAPSNSPVLITGESGTGKELAARAMHDLSSRAKGRFVAINCASIAESLMESELFGHERGAFTGAHQTKVGHIELADGGTLFLDEVGELPLHLQPKLLRVLQEHELTRVGGLNGIRVDIRVVSATNRDLEKEIAAGTFREDLYYRLNVITVEMPALRQRRDDIIPLARHFLELKAARYKRPGLRYSDAVLDVLRNASWRGNVRELENLVERLVVLAETDVITTDLLPSGFGNDTPRTVSADGVTKLALSAQAMVEEVPDFKSARDSFEREYLEALLRTHNGNVTEAARVAGMSRRNLYDKIEKLGIPLDMIKSEK